MNNVLFFFGSSLARKSMPIRSRILDSLHSFTKCSGHTRTMGGGLAMFNVQTLAQRIRKVQPDIQSLDSFEDWFVAASWGHYDVHGDSLSNAIAAVSHVLYSYRADELNENEVPGELATAVRPFDRPASSAVVVFSSAVEKEQYQFATGTNVRMIDDVDQTASRLPPVPASYQSIPRPYQEAAA
jgi:hypothetical protein